MSTVVSTKERILRAAMQVIVDGGIPAFTQQAVAQAAGMKQGNLTYHFPTKDDLLEGMSALLAEDYASLIYEMVESIRVAVLRGETIDPLEEIVSQLLDDSLTANTAHLFNALWSLANHSPEVAKNLFRLYDRAVEALMDALGVPHDTSAGQDFRAHLYLLGTVLEGSSSVLFVLPPDDPARTRTPEIARQFLLPALRDALEKARAAAAS